MKETIFTRHRNTIEPMMLAKVRKATLQALYTDAVKKAVRNHERKALLHDRHPSINNLEKDLTREDARPLPK